MPRELPASWSDRRETGDKRASQVPPPRLAVGLCQLLDPQECKDPAAKLDHVVTLEVLEHKDHRE